MLAWEIPWTEQWWWATVHGVTRVGYNLATKPPLPPGKYTAHLGLTSEVSGRGRESAEHLGFCFIGVNILPWESGFTLIDEFKAQEQ